MSDVLLSTTGANPILPPGIYIPDGEPKVFDGRVYLYGSHDLFGGTYCSYDYHVYSAPVGDLTRWTDHGVSFRSRGEDGGSADVPWSDAVLFAPDLVKRDGVYYLYFCLSDGSEGVAQSDSPAGPFINARRITMNGEPITGIDPSVLDDDGVFYYTWGQFSMKMAQLADDMCTLKPETYRDGVITNRDGAQGFHEGSSLRKIGGRYCIVYASEWKREFPNRGASPTKLDYAISDSPYGPYARRGTVIDNFGIDPKSWNDHGSIIKIADRWHVFYHGSSNGTEYSRRARVERLEVDETNAVIRQAEMTSNGFLEALPVSLVKSPVTACRFFGGAYVTERPDGTFPLVNLTGGGMEYRYVRFKAGKYRLTVRYRLKTDAAVRVLLDGEPVSRFELPGRKNEAHAELETPARDARLTLMFDGADGEITKIELEALR